jgi:hypothetical protein
MVDWCKLPPDGTYANLCVEDSLESAIFLIRSALIASQQGMQNEKLLPILIGLSLTGFSAMSQAENLLQVTSRHVWATLICVNQRPIVMLRLKRLTKRVALATVRLGADYTYSNGFRDANGVTPMSPAPHCN